MRRLSSTVTPSRLALATIPEQIENENEAPSSICDADSDMDKALRFEKRNQESAMRLRKINSVAEKLLEGKLQVLKTDFFRTRQQIKREVTVLREELKEINQPTVLPKIHISAPSLVGSSYEKILRETPSPPGTQESACQSCLYGTQQSECKHFPCFLPVTYNSLGFQNRPQTYSVVNDYDKLIKRCRTRRPTTKMEVREQAENIPSVEEILETPPMARVSIREKERGLKQLVKEMKERNEKTKPRDWATNYGAPMSRRVLLKPVVPVRNNI